MERIKIMNEILVIISRVLAIISMVNTMFCLFIRIKNKISYCKLMMISGFIFISLLIISIIYNVVVIMCDFVKNSVMYSDMAHIVLYFVMCGIINFIIAIWMLIVSLYKVEFKDNEIIIYRPFKIKKTINILDIDKNKSEYILDNRKSLFKNSVLLNHNEYVVLFTKNGERIRIGLNIFLYTNKNIEPLMYFVSNLKLARKEIK